MEIRVRKRCLSLFVSVALLLVALSARLFTIQLMESKKYIEIGEKQSMTLLSGLSGRGSIYDRNGKAITEMEESFLLLIEKRKIDKDLQKLLDSADARKVNRTNERYSIYSVAVMDRETEEVLRSRYGALLIINRERYTDNQPAVHVVGYLNERDATGACGIEKDFDEVLSKSRKAYYGKADGQGYLISGLGLEAKGGDEQYGVVTTLDLELQYAAEKVLAEAGVSGAVIITDPGNGDILASASSPVFNPRLVVDYLDSDRKEFLNKAFSCQYPPGSVFKIVVAAAVMESGVVHPETKFVCNGYYEVDGVRIKCSAGGPEGHGEMTFAEAFADSCNSAFIQAGELAGGETILKMADAFGMGREAITGVSGQGAGNLPLKEDVLGAGIGNLSIGQGKLLATPMQAARITSIIAAEGMDTGLALIRGTMDGTNGLRLHSRKQPERILSEETAEAIRMMMAETVRTGTADNLVVPAFLSAAGKTGSAEETVQELSMVHSWFVGFVPSEKPKYTITVFVENGGSGRKSAVPIFSNLLRELSFD